MKEWWERHPLYVFFIAFGLASAFWSWFSGEHVKIAQEHAANELEKAKKELQAKIDDCNSCFSSIERHVGDKSLWDLSALMVTPLQMKNLGPSYVYHDDIHCYLSVPDSVSWKPMKVDGIGWQMLFGNPKASDEDLFFELQKKRNIYVWKGPGLFKINTIDVDTPTLYIFPFISIEEIDNQEFSETVLTVAKNLKERFVELNAGLTRLGQSIRDLGEKLKQISELTHQEVSGQSGWPAPLLRNPQSNPDTGGFEKFLASLQERFESCLPPPNSDSSAFWGSQFILQGFQLAKKIPNSSFRLLNSEKKENVFYLSFETVFHSFNATAKIYWDQELILIANGKTTLLVTTSVPWSADTRFTESSWIAGWLAGLKVPLEQQ